MMTNSIKKKSSINNEKDMIKMNSIIFIIFNNMAL